MLDGADPQLEHAIAYIREQLKDNRQQLLTGCYTELTLHTARRQKAVVDFEIEIPEACAFESLERRVEAWADALGLTCTLKSSLQRFPGSLHWHFKQGKLKGTLEMTLSASQRRLWCSIQSGRIGNWQEEAVGSFKTWMRDCP
ncbi:hypothetical protein LBMAG21_12380 [Armatimonadota bacterium]|nr:hypothetical protein LBMAG21_12380 [Armatimonadota bacterium]